MNEEDRIVATEEGDLRLKGRAKSKGKVEGAVLKSRKALSLVRDVNPETSEILSRESGIMGESVSQRVLIFPHAKKAKDYTQPLMKLKKKKLAPVAIVSEALNITVTQDAASAGIPAVDRLDISLLETGDDVVVSGTNGFVVLKNVVLKNVTTSVITSKGKVLILKRSDDVGTYKGRWACVSGYMEKGETADKTALREISEELGLNRDEFAFVRKGKVLYARDKGIIWTVHPFLFEAKTPDIQLDWEHIEFKWIYPEDIESYSTVPKLKETMESVFVLNE
ncbi:MAG: NUDIX domain-containing protein [Thermoplasmata archaeon]|nr:MAG: NUDIX domain-containing protein [Thermoplasmata archaeon]